MCAKIIDLACYDATGAGKPPARCEEREGYLYCSVVGECSLQFCLDYFDYVSQQCKRRGYNKVLVEEYIRGRLSTQHIYTLYLRLTYMLRDIRIALVDTFPGHEFKNSFAERVAQEKGCDMKIFYREDDAVKWLLGQQD